MPDSEQLSLTRQAKCTCGKIVPSDPSLAFFESTDEGSKPATLACKHCSYYEVAHTNPFTRNRHICNNFEPHGAWEYDRYYCGHAGWD